MNGPAASCAISDPAGRAPAVSPDAGPTEVPCTTRRRREAPRPLSLRHNFVWIVTGNAVQAVSRWGIVLVLAHLGGVAMIGQVVLAFAVCAPVFCLADLGLRGALVTDTRREYRFGNYLGLRLASTLAALLIVVGIVLTGGYKAGLIWIILAIAVGKCFESLSDILHGLLQQHECMDRIGIALIIRGPLALAMLALGVYLTGSLLWGMAGFSLAMAVTFFGFDCPNGLRILKAPSACGDSPGAPTTAGVRPEPRSRVARLIQLAWLSLPLGLVMLMVSLTTNIPRYLISFHLGEHALGIFASIAYLATVETMVVTAMGQSAAARLAKYYAAGNAAAFCRLLVKLLGLVTCLGAALVLLVAFLGRPVLGLLYGAEVAEYADLAVYVLLAVAIGLLANPFSKAINAMRRFKTHLVIRAANVLLLLVLLPGLIGAYGLKGAAAAMLITAIFQSLVYLGVVLLAIRSLSGSALEAVGEGSA